MVDVVGLRNQLHESSGYPVVRARETYDNPGILFWMGWGRPLPTHKLRK